MQRTTTPVDDTTALADALERFAEVFSHADAHSALGQYLACSEADALPHSSPSQAAPTQRNRSSNTTAEATNRTRTTIGSRSEQGEHAESPVSRIMLNRFELTG